MSEAADIIRVLGTAIGGIVGAFVPPAGVAIAAVGQGVGAAIDIAEGNTRSNAAKTAATPARNGTDAPIPELSGPKVKRTPPMVQPSVRVTEIAEEPAEQAATGQAVADAATDEPQLDMYDYTIRALRETGQQSPDTLSLITGSKSVRWR